jgi:RNA polymerase sigma-70 factor (ECF subfamily)
MSDTAGLVDHLFRDRAGQMVAWLTRVFGPAHLDLAEEVVQDALLEALQQWPFHGVPENPAAWLFQVARNGALDSVRRDTTFRNRAPQIAAELNRALPAVQADAVDPILQDDELRMIFLCCHPALTTDARVSLSLKTAGGFSAREIARAFLTSESTVAQRLVRAKRRLRELDVRFDLPSGSELSARRDSVLEVIYLLFNEGYATRDGDELIRLDLCREGLRLARLVADSVAATSPAAHALAALLALQISRLPSRVDDRGEIVLLEAQDRTLWDTRLIALGFDHLEKSAEGAELTMYHVQAAIAAEHARARSADETDWPLILRLYDDLVRLTPSPLVRLNRLVALWKVRGPLEAFDELTRLEPDASLAGYYLLPALKGRLLAATGDRAGAAVALESALALPCSEPERRFLRREIAKIGR